MSAHDRVISGKAWEDFCDSLKAAGQTILRPETPETEIDRAEGFRYLSRLARAGLEMMVEFSDVDFPVFYALSHETIKIGSDNPDNTYRNCIISGDRDYRVTGTRGTAPLMTFGTKAERYAIDGTQASTGELDSNFMEIASDGSFEIILSATKKPGNWLPMAADSSMLIVRETHFDRKEEIPAQMTIECLNGPAKPTPLSAAVFDTRLKSTAAFRDLMVQLEGTENRIAVERMRFNEAAQTFNTARNRFPTVVMAGMFGRRFAEKAYFKAQDGAAAAPQVHF